MFGKIAPKRPKYSMLQKHIASSLVERPLTADQLVSELRTPLPHIERELKELLKLKVISKTSTGTYAIKPEIAEAVAKRREIGSKDDFALRIRMVIEGQAIEKDLLNKTMGKIEYALRKEPSLTIYDCALAKTIKQGEHYTAFLEVNLSVRDLTELVRLMFFYGPSSVEVLKPEKYEITLDELQDALVEMSHMVNSYNHYLIKLLNRQELEEFHKKIFS